MYLLPPKAMGTAVLPLTELKEDRRGAQTFGRCALGQKALFLSDAFPLRTGYLPLHCVERVFKRLAVSKGYFDGGVFGTLPYLVVRYDGGRERAFRFRQEEQVNLLLQEIRRHTDIPVGKK